MGASIYQDDFFLDLEGHSDIQTGLPYDLLFGTATYSEKFTVTTYSIGTRFYNFAVDFGSIKTKYEQEVLDTEINIYSASYIYKNFMFNIAYRNEKSSSPRFVNDILVYEENKNATFAGAQVSLGKHFIIGLNYNYFLLRETSILGVLSF